MTVENNNNKVLNVPALRFPEFTEEWKRYKLLEVCSFYSGGTPSSSKKEYYNGDIPFIRSGELHKDNTELFITEDGLNNSAAKMVEAGDLLLALYGATSGDIAISKIKGAINQAILCIRTKQNKKFIESIWNKHVERLLQTYLQGGQGNLSADIVKNIPFYFASCAEQNKLAQFVSLLDERIATQNKIIEKLETLIKGIRNYVLNNKLQNTTKKKLGELCTITTGKLDANAMKSEGLYPFFTCAEEVYRIDSFAFDTEALLVSGNGANLGYIHYYKGKFNAYQRTYVLSNFIEDIHYIQIYLEAYLHKRIALEKSTSNTPYIVLATLAEMPIIIPNIKIQKDISNKILILKSKLITEIHIRNCYKDMRQFLLSQMFM